MTVLSQHKLPKPTFIQFNQSSVPAWMGGQVDGWEGGWMDEWVGGCWEQQCLVRMDLVQVLFDLSPNR